MKLDFEVKFKETRVAFPSPSIHVVLLAGGNKSSSLLLDSEPTVSHPRALGQMTKGASSSVPGRPNQHCKLSSRATLRHRCSSAHVCSMCKQNSTFLPNQFASRGRMVRAHLPHLHPTSSWIPRDKLQPPNAAASLVVLFSISVSKAPKEARTASVTSFQ